jgi:hypothetical protein
MNKGLVVRREHENQNFFHYEVDGTTLKTNLEAFRALKTARLKNPRAKPKFVMDFDFLKNPDKNLWQTEPPESLSFYMDKHAVLLSEKFNKIILVGRRRPAREHATFLAP